MHQIEPRLIFVGNASDGRAFSTLLDQGIRAIVQLAYEEAPLQLPREFVYCRFPFIDGAGNNPELLYLAVRTLADLLQKSTATLVCCGAGMSRAPAIAAAAISVTEQISPDDSLRCVHEYHATDVAPGLWQDVKTVLAAMS